LINKVSNPSRKFLRQPLPVLQANHAVQTSSLLAGPVRSLCLALSRGRGPAGGRWAVLATLTCL
jgi:hypothetical protein